MKAQANTKQHHEEFEVGDRVFLKMKPYRQSSLARRRFEKLAARYYGPFQVVQRLGQVAYRLELPDTAAIHPEFHVSQLRHAHGVNVSSPLLPP